MRRLLFALAATLGIALASVGVAQESTPSSAANPNSDSARSSQVKAAQNVPSTAELIRSFRSIYVHPATWLSKPEMCEGELQSPRHREFYEWGLTVLKDSSADTVLKIDHQPGWFYYPYSLTHNATGVVLVSGTVTAWDGMGACRRVADEVYKRLALARPVPNDESGKKKK